MREIKFRIWDNGNMIYDVSPVFKDRSLNGGIKSLIDSGYILMQYTGLKDNNGKEIYEGDIIYQGEDKECWFAPRVVEFIDGCWKGSHINSNNPVRIYVEQDKNDYKGLVSNNEWVIVGNIYEHKNLLDGE